MKILYIFDLDGTVIDSTHRQLTLPNGKLDLAHWRENNTPEKIAQDSLLPLADHWRDVASKPGNIVAICTARVLGAPDFQFLRDHNLPWEFCFSRQGERDTRPDSVLKRDLLQRIMAAVRPDYAVFYDDVPGNRAIAESLGIYTFDPVIINAALKAAKALEGLAA